MHGKFNCIIVTFDRTQHSILTLMMGEKMRCISSLNVLFIVVFINSFVWWTSNQRPGERKSLTNKFQLFLLKKKCSVSTALEFGRTN